MEKQYTKHKHFEMGTGKYKFIGIWSAPSKAILEANPTAYNNEMDSRPKCCKFSCSHCGMGISNHHMIQDTNGEQFSVGSSCIEKLGDYVLTTASKEAEKKRQRDIRQAKAQAKRDEENKKREAEYQRQRDVNGGLTDWEVEDKARKDAIEVAKEKREDIAEPLLEILREKGGDFCNSIARSIVNHGDMPTRGGRAIVIEIMAKRFGRKGSKKYEAAYDEQVRIFDEIAEAIEKTQ